jgi:hypothetical protein
MLDLPFELLAAVVAFILHGVLLLGAVLLTMQSRGISQPSTRRR